MTNILHSISIACGVAVAVLIGCQSETLSLPESVPADQQNDEKKTEGGLFGDWEDGTYKPLLHDFDIARLNDLKVLGGEIERYRELTGKYPLQGESNLPTYVYIATAEQQQFVLGKPPYAHKVTPVEVFLDELRSVLGEEFELPFDPQRVMLNRPNFYLYLMTDDTYFLAVHLFEDYSITQHVRDHYHKLEITNVDLNRPGVWRYDKLMKNRTFQAAANRTPHRPGYIEKLRKRLGGNNAFPKSAN